MNRKLFLSSLSLIVISVLILIISYYLPQQLDWWQNLLLNFGAGILGSLFIIYLYNRVLDKMHERERRQRESIAIIQLAVPLKQHFHFLFDMYKCSLLKKPEIKFVSIEDVLGKDFYQSVKFLDLKKPSPASSLGNVKWYEYIEDCCKLFNNALQDIIRKYAQNLSPQAIEIIENIRNSGFIITGQNLRFIINFNPFKSQEVEFPGNFYINSESMIEEYIGLFKTLVEYFNQNVSPNKKLMFEESMWKNDFFPIGCSRIENK